MSIATLSQRAPDGIAPARHAAAPAASAPPLSDALLIARVLGGDDRHAFAELVRRHQSSVRTLLRRLTRHDHGLADDLAQDTFIQVHRNLRQFRGDAKFATWIYRIAYNVFLAHVRAARHDEELPEQLAEVDSGPSLSRTTALKMDLSRAMAILSEGERAAIIQCYYQDLSHEEAAYVLGCPLGTVKTNVARAKQKMRAVLAAWSPASS
ncbi:MAG: sigma-70 family RNA polymerase sigma factor [Betaproteobacteria bacterium]